MICEVKLLCSKCQAKFFAAILSDFSITRSRFRQCVFRNCGENYFVPRFHYIRVTWIIARGTHAHTPTLIQVGALTSQIYSESQ